MPLQLPEGFGHFQEWRSIAQSARLAQNNCQIVPPVIDRLPRLLVRADDNSVVLAQDLPLGRDDQPIGIDPQANWPVRKGSREALRSGKRLGGNRWCSTWILRCSSKHTKKIQPQNC